MTLSKETVDEIENKFKEIMEILNVMDAPETNTNDDPIDENEEALKFIEWMKTKAELRYGTKNEDGNYLKTERPSFGITVGGLYWGYYGTNIGDEMNKYRPLLVVRATKASNMVTVVPVSLQRMNDNYYFHVDLENRNGTAIVEQLRTIDKKRLHKRIHHGGKPFETTDKNLKEIFAAIEKYYAEPPGWLKKRWDEEESS